MNKEIKSKSYTIYDNNGSWLGQIVLTSDGLYASVTDYGNLSFAWRSFRKDDFRKFICSLNVDYFSSKMYIGNSYILSGNKCQDACNRYGKMILPALKLALKEDLELNPNW